MNRSDFESLADSTRHIRERFIGIGTMSDANRHRLEGVEANVRCMVRNIKRLHPSFRDDLFYERAGMKVPRK